MNRNFGKLDENDRIGYAPNNVRIGGTIYANPTAEQYAAFGKTREEIDAFLDSIPTEEVR